MDNRKKLNIIRILFCIILFILLITLFLMISNAKRQLTVTYETGIRAFEAGDYSRAIALLSDLGNYKDCLEILDQAQKGLIYNEAQSLYDKGEFEAAAQKFKSISDFKDSQDKAAESLQLKYISEEQEEKYQAALDAINAEKYNEAKSLLNSLGSYKDSEELNRQCLLILRRLIQSHTISAGVVDSVGIKKDGTVLYSGKNKSKRNTIGLWENIISVEAKGEFILGLTNIGTVVSATGNSKYRIDTSGWNDIVDIAVGQQYIVGLKSDGTVLSQGIDGYGETDIDKWEKIIMIDAGWQHTVGLDTDGEIHIAGYHSQEQLDEIELEKEQWTDVVAIAAGGGNRNTGRISSFGHTVALRKDGTVLAVGDNSRGQCDVDDWTDIIAISAGDFHTVGLKADGTVVTTRLGDIQDMSTWTDIIAISAGYGFTLGLKSDGTVMAAGYNEEGQCDVSQWVDIMQRDEWKLALGK